MDIIKALLSDVSERNRSLGRPVVTLSYAQSLDGSLTSGVNKRLVISGPETKRLTHLLRAAHEAILVGIGTLLTDDPKLNARLVGGPHPQVVVLDAGLRTPTTAQVLQRTDLKALIVCENDVSKSKIQALEKAGGRILRVNGDGKGRLDLLEVLHGLNRMGLRSLMVEGGAEVANSFLQARLVDQVVITVASIWTGAEHAGVRMINADSCFPMVVDPHYDTYGRDLVVWGRIGEGRYEEQDAVFHRS